MTYLNPTSRTPRRRLHPKRTRSSEEIAQWYAEREAFYQRCKPIFDRLKPELIKTHYNWYMAVEPDSGEYFIDKDDMLVANIAHEKYPKVKLHVFRINETGVCGTI
ncbi:hypothetical protein QUB60_15820 [Microcoleus sp. A2-C5]|uniref:hypothetical protein n=1 Tax=Microcoleaceae TaxID=1892252 RepID=UPI0022371FC4|nr:hypothetical protein [Lyngbya sp. CCAP 1446/10]MCW6051435.1 hypothetical protein [Lyngbya sp. CCAP 1446/10]